MGKIIRKIVNKYTISIALLGVLWINRIGIANLILKTSPYDGQKITTPNISQKKGNYIDDSEKLAELEEEIIRAKERQILQNQCSSLGITKENIEDLIMLAKAENNKQVFDSEKIFRIISTMINERVNIDYIFADQEERQMVAEFMRSLEQVTEAKGNKSDMRDLSEQALNMQENYIERSATIKPMANFILSSIGTLTDYYIIKDLHNNAVYKPVLITLDEKVNNYSLDLMILLKTPNKTVEERAIVKDYVDDNNTSCILQDEDPKTFIKLR